MIWISGNKNLSQWHLGLERELRGEKTGTIMSRYLVTACTGKTLGGAWGYSRRTDKPNPEICCKRCVTLASKE